MEFGHQKNEKPRQYEILSQLQTSSSRIKSCQQIRQNQAERSFARTYLLFQIIQRQRMEARLFTATQLF